MKTKIILCIPLLFYVFFLGCKGKETGEIEKCTKIIISAIQSKDDKIILQYIPDNYKLNVYKDFFITKNEVIEDFKKKGRIYELFFCGDSLNEEAPLCAFGFLNNQNVEIKKIERLNSQEDIYVVKITWKEKEEAEKDKNNITSYFDKLTLIKITNKWYLHDLDFWKN